MEDKKIRVLLIEDNPGDARLIREFLSTAGSASFLLEHADRLSIGLARLAHNDIDVILLDLSLSDSHGLDGLGKILAQTLAVPIVVLSGLSDEAVAIKSVQEGAQDYLVKGKIESNLLVRSIIYAIERQRLRVALRESEARYRLLADNAADIIWTANMKWQITYISPSAKRMFGYTVEEMKRLAIKDILTPDSLNQANKLIRNQLDIMTPESKYPPLSLTLEHVRKDGSKLWAEVMLSFLWDKDGRLSEILGVTREVTERKKAEEALQESEQRYRMLAENMKDIIWTRDMNLKLTYTSPSVQEMSGYSVEEVMSMSLVESLTPASLERIEPIISKVLAASEKGQGDLPEELVLEADLIRKDGSITPVEMKINLLRDPAGHPTGFLGVTRDITERKRAEEALRESEEEMRAIFDNAGNGIALLDLEGKVIRVNKRILEVGGYDQEIISGKSLDLLTMFTPESLETMSQIKDMVLSGKEVTAFECEVVTKAGKKLNLEINVGPFFLKGQLSGLVAVMRDITERKQMEKALQESKEELQAIFDNARDGIILLDAEGRVIRVNRRVLEVGGYDFNEVANKRFDLFEMVTPESIERMLAAKETILSGGEVPPFEVELTIKSGKRLTLEVHVTPFNKGGKFIGSVAVLRDITERKKSESALRESEVRFRTVFEGTSLGIALVDFNAHTLGINPAFERMLGYNLEEFREVEGNLKYQHPEDARVDAKLYIELLKGNREHYTVDKRYIRKDGQVIWGRQNLSVVRDDKGKPKYFIAMLEDITERKRIEEALQQSEERYRELIENANDIIYTHDLAGNFTSINKAGEQVTGYMSNELLVMNISSILTPDSLELARQMIAQKVNKGGSTQYELEIIAKDGRHISLEVNSRLIFEGNKPIGVQGIARDITERKKMEQELLRLSDAFKMSMDSIVITDLEGNIIDVNEMTLEMQGTKNKADLIGLKSPDFMALEDREKTLQDLADIMEKGSVKNIEYNILTRDGRKFLIETNASIMRSKDGEAVGIVAVSRDITERRQMEDALRQSEQNYRILFEGTIDGMFVTDALTMKVVLANTNAAKMLGFDSAYSTIGVNPLDLVHPDDKEQVLHYFIQDASGQSEQEVHEFRAIAKDGREIWISGMGTRIEYGGKLAVLSSIRDITERKLMEEEKGKMEEQLRLAGRLAAVGELASGVAHELNNPIAAIQGFAQFLTARKDLDETLRKDLNTIYQESQRAAKITQNLLSFARRHEPEKQLISINEAIEKTLELQAHPMKVNNIEIIQELDPKLPKTLADFHQMQQVFMNILNNAEQAMVEANGKGRLILKTQKAGSMIRISFADNGPGIPEENIKRIFDPFFTTKEVGKGTGLGLSICYGLVEAHGGHIYARSKPGHGATLVVEIPIVSESQLIAEAALLKLDSRGATWKKPRGQY